MRPFILPFKNLLLNGIAPKTKKLSKTCDFVICESFDIVTVPFPFTDQSRQKRRPALLLSPLIFNSNGYSVMAMITTKGNSIWQGDTEIEKLQDTGLNASCCIRLKIFTIDNRLIQNKIGKLSLGDTKKFMKNYSMYMIPKLPKGK